MLAPHAPLPVVTGTVNTHCASEQRCQPNSTPPTSQPSLQQLERQLETREAGNMNGSSDARCASQAPRERGHLTGLTAHHPSSPPSPSSSFSSINRHHGSDCEPGGSRPTRPTAPCSGFAATLQHYISDAAAAVAHSSSAVAQWVREWRMWCMRKAGYQHPLEANHVLASRRSESSDIGQHWHSTSTAADIQVPRRPWTVTHFLLACVCGEATRGPKTVAA